MSGINKIAIAGATGNLGSHVLAALLQADFQVTVLTRSKEPASDGSTANVIQVDYNSVKSLTSALNKQDAVVSTVGIFAVETQKMLIDAAIAAGVKRFIPSDFSSCSTHPELQAMPFYSSLATIRRQLMDSAENAVLSYTVLSSGGFLDYILTTPILLDFDTHTATLIDGGDNRLSINSLASIGKAIVGILKNPDETKNRVVHISEVIVTQNTLLDIVKEVDPTSEWFTSTVKSSELLQQALDVYATGDTGFASLVKILSGTSLAGDKYGAAYDETENELLGIDLLSREDLKKLVTERLRQRPSLKGGRGGH